MATNLHRSNTNKVLGGVAGGIGEYFNFDPTIIRIIFILLTIFGGSGILIYVLLWILLPADSKSSAFTSESIKDNFNDIKDRAEKFAQDLKFSKDKNKSTDKNRWFGVILLVIGLLFLFNNLGLDLSVGKFWPLILIAIGFAALSKK